MRLRRVGRGPERTATALVLALAVLLTGVSCGRAAVVPGSLADGGLTLEGRTYRVGGKDFPEQRVLCQITLVALRSLGATADDRCGIPSAATRAALAPTARIDLYWEYLTTAGTFLGPLPDTRDPAVLHRAVADADAARNGVVWLPPAPFDDSYALAVSRASADRLGVRTIGDWARLVRSGSPEATLCVEPEFAARSDGLGSLRAAYGVGRDDRLDGPPGLSVVDADVVYEAVARANPCVFGEVFSTDGRVRGRDLVLLDDDRDHFPPYNAAPTVRREVLERDPALAPVLTRLSARLTDDVVSDLNARVSVDGRDPTAVATDWLVGEGLVGRG